MVGPVPAVAEVAVPGVPTVAEVSMAHEDGQ
jgi:hypothetical protein